MPPRQPNPYRPGFNQAPVVFAGRKSILDGANEALQVAAYDGRTPRPLILVGPRGVGKTVTLGEIASHAAQQLAWPTVHIEATSAGVLGELSLRLQHVNRALQGTVTKPGPKSERRLTSGKIEAQVLGSGFGIELGFDPTSADADIDAASALRQVLQTATERNAGLLLTFDELQNAPAGELATLGSILQEAVPQGWPLVVAIAALPSLRTTRGPKALPTYLERAEWHELRTLDTGAAHEALTEPARIAGRPVSAAAAQELLKVAGGYPYAIQVAGHYVWRASSEASEVTLAHVEAAMPKVEADLEQLFLSRWDDASGREQEYLVALATAQRDLDIAHGGDVARVLGKSPKSVAFLRDRLIKKGTIYADGRHRLFFITPGMQDWIIQRHT